MHLVLRHAVLVARTIQTVEERTDAHDVGELAAKQRASLRSRVRVSIAPSCAATASAPRARPAAPPPARRRCPRLARNEDAGHVEFAPCIGLRREAKLRVIPAMRGAQRLRELRIRHDALMQQDHVGFDAMRRALRREAQARAHARCRPCRCALPRADRRRPRSIGTPASRSVRISCRPLLRYGHARNADNM